ncbi:MAG: hypothetical protein VB102_15040 [Paludibacter sp.]|nr:hypothetical protein [Paludibacter sp.]
MADHGQVILTFRPYMGMSTLLRGDDFAKNSGALCSNQGMTCYWRSKIDVNSSLLMEHSFLIVNLKAKITRCFKSKIAARVSSFRRMNLEHLLTVY